MKYKGKKLKRNKHRTRLKLLCHTFMLFVTIHENQKEKRRRVICFAQLQFIYVYSHGYYMFFSKQINRHLALLLKIVVLNLNY